MKKQQTIPEKDSDFNVVQDIIFSMASGNRTKWLLDGEWLDNEVMPKKDRWDNGFGLYQNPATRTPLITFEKNEARKEYEPLLRKLVGILEYNTKVTDDDRREMGIVIRSSSHTPIPVPTTYPEYRVATDVLRRLTVHFHDQGSEHRGKPAGVSGAVIRWALLDTPPQNVDDLHHSALDTSSPFTVEFSEEQRGSRVYFCLAWQNPKGEKGPWSEIQSAIIP
jgi:hypothetical protein